MFGSFRFHREQCRMRQGESAQQSGRNSVEKDDATVDSPSGMCWTRICYDKAEDMKEKLADWMRFPRWKIALSRCDLAKSSIVDTSKELRAEKLAL